MSKTNYCKPNYRIATEKLTRWIKRQGKQKEIAEGIGISPQLMSYKIHNNSFSAEDILKIFHYLHTDEDEIIKIMTY